MQHGIIIVEKQPQIYESSVHNGERCDRMHWHKVNGVGMSIRLPPIIISWLPKQRIELGALHGTSQHELTHKISNIVN
jgi:hypothetical protein